MIQKKRDIKWCKSINLFFCCIWCGRTRANAAIVKKCNGFNAKCNTEMAIKLCWHTKQEIIQTIIARIMIWTIKYLRNVIKVSDKRMLKLMLMAASWTHSMWCSVALKCNCVKFLTWGRTLRSAFRSSFKYLSSHICHVF